MKFSWKNIENWQSWKMRFFWGGHFEFSTSAILNFFLLNLCEKSSPFIWGIIFFCTMDGFSRILEKKLYELQCTRLYHWGPRPCFILFSRFLSKNNNFSQHLFLLSRELRVYDDSALLKANNLCVTSKNETTNSPIHQFTNSKRCKMSLKWKRSLRMFVK